MSKKSLLTLLSTAAISAVAALSVPVTATVAAPSAETKSRPRRSSATSSTSCAWRKRLSSAYDGRIKGLQATRPKKGQKIDPNSPAVVEYMSFLESRQDAALASVGGGKKVYSYGFVFSGFAAELTTEQAAKLASMPGVLGVIKDEAHHSTPRRPRRSSGLTGPGGVWDKAQRARA